MRFSHFVIFLNTHLDQAFCFKTPVAVKSTFSAPLFAFNFSANLRKMLLFFRLLCVDLFSAASRSSFFKYSTKSSFLIVTGNTLKGNKGGDTCSQKVYKTISRKHVNPRIQPILKKRRQIFDSFPELQFLQ